MHGISKDAEIRKEQQNKNTFFTHMRFGIESFINKQILIVYLILPVGHFYFETNEMSLHCELLYCNLKTFVKGSLRIFNRESREAYMTSKLCVVFNLIIKK